MNTKPQRLSVINHVLVGSLAIAVAAACYYRAWAVVIGCVFVLAFVAWPIHQARRGQGSTAARINAFQPYDERDRRLSDQSHAILGQAALIGQFLIFMLAVARNDPADVTGEAIRLLALCGISLACTAFVLRKG